MDSSLATTRPTHPLVTLLRYTSGVFPINCAHHKRISFYGATSKSKQQLNPLPERNRRKWAGAHLGDVLGDRRRGLSHWVTKLKNPRDRGKKDQNLSKIGTPIGLVWFPPRTGENRERGNVRIRRRNPGGSFRGRTGGSRRSWGLENFGRSRWR